MNGRSTVALYCLVQIGKTLLWVANDLVAFYVLAVLYKMDAAAITLLMVGGLGWHALSDLAAGWASERCGGHVGRLAAITGIAVPLSAVTFVGMVLLASNHLCLAILCMMVSRSSYALYDVPHHALLGRMAARGMSAGRLVGQRNFWGQLGSLALAVAVTPWLAADMSRETLGNLLLAIALAATLLSLPLVPLLRRYWTALPLAQADETVRSGQRSRRFVPAIVAGNLAITLLVAVVAKIAVSNPFPVVALPGGALPGLVLSALMLGRLLASTPLPASLLERLMPATFLATLAGLLGTTAWLIAAASPVAVLCFGIASGLINILTWGWIAQADVRPRMFAITAMTSKVGMALAIPIAALLVAPGG